jgi:hypothetical protein
MQADIGIYLFSRLTSFTPKVRHFFRALALPLSPVLLSIFFFRDVALHVTASIISVYMPLVTAPVNP